MSNPIEERINGGMNPLVAFLTEATCGEACWHAREDTCRCSCGGKNHGCLRSADGTRPERTARIDGTRYVLKGVGFDTHKPAYELNKAHGITFVYADSAKDSGPIPAKTRCATDSQVEGWPELSAYRDGPHWTEDNGRKHYVNKPYLLWIRADVADSALPHS